MNQNYPRLFISAPHKSSGKTTLTLGLARAFRERGIQVQCFKKGPDYIDPMWHQAATGKPSYNLDPYMMEEGVIRQSFARHAISEGINLIEGNHGLHDGLASDGTNSSAGLALQLDAPVLLIVDVTGTNRGIAANVLGQIMLEPRLKVAGVILNRVASKRQEAKQIAAIEEHCKVPVLGAIPKFAASENEDFVVSERHLGLVTTEEEDNKEKLIANMARLVAEHCDLEKILELASSTEPLATVEALDTQEKKDSKVRIGVVRDSAFCFYYPENLEALEQAGAELVFLNSMEDTSLPQMDGLYIGGGFPESFLPELEQNESFRLALAEKIKAGMPAYVECGGLIYCAEQVGYQGKEYKMLGILEGKVSFSPKPVGYGYMELEVQKTGHWMENPEEKNAKVKGHEFHYSSLDSKEQKEGYPQLFKVKRGVGLGKGEDGILIHNLVASYAHIHASATPWWAKNFVEFIVSIKEKNITI